MNTRQISFPDWMAAGPELTVALQSGQPVVALESTVISHGLPWPQNLEAAQALERIVREAGAIPATLAIMDGRVRLGLDTEQLFRLARAGTAAVKCSSRDLGWVLAKGKTGATTVAASIVIAEQAGVRVFATGGIGGVHRGAAANFDISADLPELARRAVAVVCAGPKAILDLPHTREYLETQGVPVLGYGCDQVPAFYYAHSGLPVDCRCDSIDELARVVAGHLAVGTGSGILVGNPIPPEAALDRSQVEAAIAQATAEAAEAGITGKAVTPFLLARLESLTGGKSVAANLALLQSNARVAAQLAVKLADSLAGQLIRTPASD